MVASAVGRLRTLDHDSESGFGVASRRIRPPRNGARQVDQADNDDDRMQKKSENVAHAEHGIRLRKLKNSGHLRNSPPTGAGPEKVSPHPTFSRTHCLSRFMITYK